MIGRTVSHFRIVEKLGEGGMGVVYRAEDTKLGRSVALKFPSLTNLSEEQDQTRFLREAQAAASLSHPNVCTVHDIYEVDGQPFIAMEFVEGRSLKERLRERPLPLSEALDFAAQAADGLAAAHDAGIVHRDIKSANLMITAQGQVKIMDFGLAQVRDRSHLTKTGTTLGTAAYMSPEQALAQETDHRTDIWSLGVVLYEMLTGRLPFGGEVEAAIAYAVVNVEPEPPTALRSGLPVELDRILGRALAKDPRDRYQHAEEMAVDLRALEPGPRKTARRRPTTASSRRRFDRRTAILAGGGLTAAALGSVAASKLGLWESGVFSVGSSAPLASILVLPLVNLTGDPEREYFVDGMTDALITNLSKVSSLTVISRRTAMRYKRTDKPLTDIAGELNIGSVVDGSVALEEDRVRVDARLVKASTGENLWGETYERAISSVLRLQADVTRAIAGEVQVALSPAEEERLERAQEVDPETYEAYLRGMYWINQRGRANALKGIAILRGAIDRDPGDALAYAGLSLGYHTLAHGPNPPPDALAFAKSTALRAVRLDDSLAEAHAALAFYQGYYDWEWETAWQSLDRALEINPNLAIAHYHASWLHYLFERDDEAVAAHRRAQELDPLAVLHTVWLGGLYACLGRFDEALVEVKKSIEFTPQASLNYHVLALTYWLQGDFSAAVVEADRAAEMAPASWRLARAPFLASAGREEEARRLIAELEGQDVAESQAYWLMWAHTNLGDLDEAYRWLTYERHHAWVPWVRVEPQFEPLRRHPRFPEALRRMNLTPP